MYSENKNIMICDHPLIKHKITILRDKHTGTNEFRAIVEELAMLIGYEATRNEETFEPEEYYCKIPKDLDQRKIYVVDPMLATGGSAIAAIDFIKQHGGSDISFLCIIAAPTGLEKLAAAHPDVKIYVGNLDRELNEKAYICPGLGDVGDRIFGTD